MNTDAAPQKPRDASCLGCGFCLLVLIVGLYFAVRDDGVKISTISRTERQVTIVWVLYDGKPEFAYIYQNPSNGETHRSGSSNSAGEMTAAHGTGGGRFARLKYTANGPITFNDVSYDLSRGRTFTLEQQDDGRVGQYDVDVPLPPEPESSERPYTFDIPNAEVMKFIRSAQSAS